MELKVRVASGRRGRLSKWKNCFSSFVCLLVTGAVESVAECVGFFVFQEATNS